MLDRLEAIKRDHALAVVAGRCAACGSDQNAIAWLLVEVQRLRDLIEYGRWRADCADRG